MARWIIVCKYSPQLTMRWLAANANSVVHVPNIWSILTVQIKRLNSSGGFVEVLGASLGCSEFTVTRQWTLFLTLYLSYFHVPHKRSECAIGSSVTQANGNILGIGQSLNIPWYVDYVYINVYTAYTVCLHVISYAYHVVPYLYHKFLAHQ